MMRRPVPALLVLALLVAALAGCGKHIGALRPPLPPDTRIFVEGPVDTVHHEVHLYWFGTDPDGYVRGYEYRYFTTPAESAQTRWTWTRETNLVFNFPDSTGYAAPVFEVRAVDSTDVPPPADAALGAPGGLRDPTPAREDFKVSNQPPVVTLISKFAPNDTTIGTATVYWTVTDPDNDLSSARFRIWLNGNNPDIVTGNSYTVPTARFFEADGHTLVTKRDTLHIQAIDDGGMAGNVDSVIWVAKAPNPGGHTHYGRLLIIDSVPDGSQLLWKPADTLYSNTAARNLPPDTYTIMKFGQYVQRWANAFRTAKDMEQTFKLFDAVVWYVAGTVNQVATFDVVEQTLKADQAGVGAYLEAGGNFYVDGLNLVEGYRAPGVFTLDFAQRYLGTVGLVQRWDVVADPHDSTAAWQASTANPPPAAYVTFGGNAADTLRLRNYQSSKGLRGFVVRDASYGFAVADPQVFTDPPSFPLVVGVSVPQPSGGRMILISFPLSYTYAPGAQTMDADTPRILAKIFEQIGAVGP
jgi:predicted small lipoprotein YifL